MKSLAIARLREATRLKYEAATTIRRRLAQSEADVEGWDDNDGNAAVWEVLRRGEGWGVTRASIATARTKALREVEALDLDDDEIATALLLVNAVHDAAGDVLEALAAFHQAARGDPDEVADLVDEAENPHDVEQEAHFKLALIDTAATVRATVNEALTLLAVDLRRRGMDRDEGEQLLRDMAFEDQP